MFEPDRDGSGSGRISPGARRRASHLMIARQSLPEPEGLDREIFIGIRPRPRGRPAGTPRESTERFDAVFVAVLGMDRFTGAEINRFTGYPHLLALQAGEMHFDAVFFTIVKGVVLKHVEPEIPAELAIDAGQQIEIEFF